MTVLNTTAEWHATAVGVLCGSLAGYRGNYGPLTAASAIATQRAAFPPGHRRDIQRESGYFAGAAVAAFVISRWLQRNSY